MAGKVRYFTVEDAARMLRLSPERVREMLEDGEIEGVRTGDPGGWRIPLHGVPEVPPPPVEPPSVPGPPAEEARQPAELPRGDAAADAAVSVPEPTSESGWVTTQQAARALGISARTVRWHIERGNLVAKPEGEGVERTWRVSVDSLQAFRDSRQPAAPPPRGSRAPGAGAETAAESPGNAIRELADRLVEEARRAEAARARLELSERAQSTLEAELAEERRRREEAERAREEAQRERDELRRRLEAPTGREPPGGPHGGAATPEATPEVASKPPGTPPQGASTAAPGGGPRSAAGRSRERRWVRGIRRVRRFLGR